MTWKGLAILNFRHSALTLRHHHGGTIEAELVKTLMFAADCGATAAILDRRVLLGR